MEELEVIFEEFDAFEVVFTPGGAGGIGLLVTRNAGESVSTVAKRFTPATEIEPVYTPLTRVRLQ